MNLLALLLAPAVLGLGAPSSAPRVATEAEACEVATARVRALDRLPGARIASCDTVAEADGAPGYHVLALHSDRACDGACSTNLGWYAVRAATGEVFDWDVVDWRLGATVGGRP